MGQDLSGRTDLEPLLRRVLGAAGRRIRLEEGLCVFARAALALGAPAALLLALSKAVYLGAWPMRAFAVAAAAPVALGLLLALLKRRDPVRIALAADRAFGTGEVFVTALLAGEAEIGSAVGRAFLATAARRAAEVRSQAARLRVAPGPALRWALVLLCAEGALLLAPAVDRPKDAVSRALAEYLSRAIPDVARAIEKDPQCRGRAAEAARALEALTDPKLTEKALSRLIDEASRALDGRREGSVPDSAAATIAPVEKAPMDALAVATALDALSRLRLTERERARAAVAFRAAEDSVGDAATKEALGAAARALAAGSEDALPSELSEAARRLRARIEPSSLRRARDVLIAARAFASPDRRPADARDTPASGTPDSVARRGTDREAPAAVECPDPAETFDPRYAAIVRRFFERSPTAKAGRE